MQLFLRKMNVYAMIIACLMTSIARAHEEHISKQEKKALAYAQGQLEELHTEFKQSLAQTMMEGVVYNEHIPSIIGETEQQELQLDWLAASFDKTQTVLGSCALRKTFRPIADQSCIKKRQELVKGLVANSQLYTQLEALLRELKTTESVIIEKQRKNISYNYKPGSIVLFPEAVGGLFAYWNEQQLKEAHQLFYRADHLYYRSFLIPGKKYLNSNRFALDGAMAVGFGTSLLQIAGMIGIQAINDELYSWWLDANPRRRLQLITAFIQGIKEPLRHFNPIPSQSARDYKYEPVKDGDDAGRDLEYTTFKQNFFDTLGSRFAVLKERFKNNQFSIFGKAIPLSPTATKIKQYGGAAATAVLYSAYRSVLLYEGLKHSSQYVVYMHRTMQQLFEHTKVLARAIDSVKKIRALVCHDSVLRTSECAIQLDTVFEQASQQLRELLDSLESDTFKCESLLYSRGRVLQAHRLFTECKNEILPALQAVAELDAIYAMATNVKERAGTDTPLTFVEFIQSQNVMISFDHCWIPVIPGAVASNLSLGNGDTTKFVITGPNGCGKSTFLKSIGHGVVLAQSWGIVPAARARMTIIDALRTCIHPQESLKDGMSTFMAEKSRVDEIQSFVLQQRGNPCKMVFLLDEPFKGTVDAESAERIYDFGKFVADIPQAIVAIATHVYKPILLAQDTQGIFKNYHVALKEPQPGIFERQFNLLPGAAYWWFDDVAKRSRFIDWLGKETLAIKEKRKNKVTD